MSTVLHQRAQFSGIPFTKRVLSMGCGRDVLSLFGLSRGHRMRGAFVVLSCGVVA